jgi:hypothetical protein
MAKIDLKKTVYNKDQFNRVTGGRGFTTFTLDGDGVTFTVEDFFNEYDNLFLSIPVFGDINSHEYLVRRSSELVGFQRTTDDIQPLLDEIASLRDQLLQSRQENINLQIEAAGGGSASALNDQFNELLAALAEPPQFNVDIEGLEGLDDALAALAAAQAGAAALAEAGSETIDFAAPNIRKTFNISATAIGDTKEIDVVREVINAYQGYNALPFTSVEIIGVQQKTTYGIAEITNDNNIRFIVDNPEILAARPASIEFTYEVKNNKQQTASNKITLSLVLPDVGSGLPGGGLPVGNGNSNGSTSSGDPEDGPGEEGDFLNNNAGSDGTGGGGGNTDGLGGPVIAN